jgi:hypothetical protein
LARRVTDYIQQKVNSTRALVGAILVEELELQFLMLIVTPKQYLKNLN